MDLKTISSGETEKSVSPEKNNTFDPDKRIDLENKSEINSISEYDPDLRIDVSDNNDGYYTDYKSRLICTPIDSENGHWEGERGESKYIPSDETEKGKRGVDKLSEYGMDGIEYKNCEPDYSRCCEGTVQIEKMTEFRPDNFSQADIKLAEKWNEEIRDGKNNWTDEDVDIFRHSNNLSWHECCDTKTMHLVSQDIHGGSTSVFLHSGGVSECKARDRVGGIFDE